MKENKEGDALVIPKEVLIECMKEALTKFRLMLDTEKRRLGARYNRNNNCEICMRNFPMKDAERVLDEYELIYKKQSNQPSTVRRVIREIGDIARRAAVEKCMKKEGIEFKDGKFVRTGKTS